MTASLGSLRVAFESSGSPSWVMRVIRSCNFDRLHDFHLDLRLGGDRGSATAQATQTVMADGRADLIDTDWLSIARSRQTGPALIAVFPYGRIMGGVVTATGSGIDSLADLQGCRVGVMRITDKNWTVIRAVCQKRHGFDPQATAAVEEALSKSTLVQWLQAGYLDAAVLPWHLIPRLTASTRFRQLCDILDLLPDLDVPSAPTTFFAVQPEFAAARQDLIAAFIASYAEAVALMRADEGVWREAAAAPDDQPEMLTGLRASWLRRICSEWRAEDALHLDALFERLRGIGDGDALGVAALPRDLFASAFIH